MANTTNRLHVVHYHTTGNTSPNSDNIMMGEIALSLSGGSEAIYTKNNSGQTVIIGTNIDNLAGLKKQNAFYSANTFNNITFFRKSVYLRENDNNYFYIGSNNSALTITNYWDKTGYKELIKINSPLKDVLGNTLNINMNCLVSGRTSINGNTIITGNATISGNTVITGTCTSTGGFYDTSDKRLKKFDGDIDVNLDDIKNIQKILFHFKNDETKKEHIGVYAQEIQKYYPQLVNEDENGYLTVDYSKLSVIALKAIDKLNEKNCILEEKINEIEKTLFDIKEKIS